jgi:hypothetical protein
VRADATITHSLFQYLREVKHTGEFVEKVCEWSLHWAALKETSETETFELPDPYEPLLILLEEGGIFYRDHSKIAVDGRTISNVNWLSYADRSPYLDV